MVVFIGELEKIRQFGVPVPREFLRVLTNRILKFVNGKIRKPNVFFRLLFAQNRHFLSETF